MNISVHVYAVSQQTIEHVERNLRVRSDFDKSEYESNSYNYRFRVSVEANSTLKYWPFVTKPSRKQISRCITETIKLEKVYQDEHKAKFGWCR